jgi:alkanesulfonate monooxygenase SsuD/methylene tetrahydromethanopterin reductase-like flavin-dependent oxidoreductase (luciferase family)
MHVGYGSFFQNIGGLRSDNAVWRLETDLAVRAEGLGYESVWTVEHHFSDYTMSPSPLQYLTWIAAQTQRVKLGSMVCVLPWHDPIRLAEEASVLDHLSGGRLVLGIGRGLGRVEFEGFGVDMSRSRQTFTDTTGGILGAFETGVIDDPGGGRGAAPIRPTPLVSLHGRTYASAISPESADIMARLGVGIMIFLQKPWEQTIADIAGYADRYREINRSEPPKPLLVMFAGCGRDPDEVQSRRQCAMAYYDSTVDHYEFDNPALAKVPGYEYYGRIAETIHKHGRESFVRFLADLQPCGTPEEVTEQVCESVRRVDGAGVIAVSSYGGMDPEVARENQDLFAAEVLPALKASGLGSEIGLPEGVWDAAASGEAAAVR